MNLRQLTTLTLTAFASLASAQMHHVDKPEQVTRAVAVYEWTGDLKKPDAARLVPVTVFLDGHLQNGGTFLAQPVPFALSIGTIYSVEKAGDPFGTLELNLARDIAARHDSDDAPLGGSWYGYGKFQPPAPPKKSNLKPSAKPVNIEGSNDDEKPHFVAPRDTTDDTPKPATPGTTDKDRPALRRNPSATDTPPDDDPDKPTLGHRDDTAPTDAKGKKPKKEKPGGYVTAANGSLNDDPDRPTIRRGPKPSDDVPALMGTPADLHQAIAVSDPGPQNLHLFTRDWDGADDRDKTRAAMQALALPRLQQYLTTNALTPAATLPPAPPTLIAGPAHDTKTPTPASGNPASEDTNTDNGTPPKLARTPNGVSTATTSHDTTNRTPDSGNPAPEKTINNDGTSPTAAALPPTARSAATTNKRASVSNARHRTTVVSTSPKSPVFLDEQLSSYELSYGGLPTFIYTAKVPATNPKSPAPQPVVYVTVVAQRLPSGNLSTSLLSVTDSAHLDRTPWLRFIDVVDADGSHRASLLFELRAQHTRQFALYRLLSATADQTFLTSSLE